MTPSIIRRTYGTPVYALAPGIESKSALDLATLPDVPESSGFYRLVDGRWMPTDGLTYREVGQTIQIRN